MKYSFKSIISLVLTLVGGSLYFLGFPTAGLIVIAIAPAGAMQETDKVTGPLQFAAFYISAGATAFFAAVHAIKAGYAVPIAGLGLLLGTSIAVLRMQFFGYITHTRFNAFEIALTPLPLVLFILGNALQPMGWEGWIIGAIFLPVQIYSNLAQAFDGLTIKRMAKGGYKVQVGEQAPGFTLKNHDGREISLEDFKGKSHVLLLFVRGDWCPHCHMMLRTYSKNVDKFQEYGIHLLAIGPDPVGVNRDMVQKLGLNHDLCEDPGLEVAGTYGINLREYDSAWRMEYEKPEFMKNEGTPLPAAFLVDINGVICYTSRPDRVGGYLDPRTIFPALEGLQKKSRQTA
ncbi:MAG: peroxiredoxin family protein [Bacteroidota bacterium]